MDKSYRMGKCGKMEMVLKEQVLQVVWESVPEEWFERLEERIEKLQMFIFDDKQ